jgi:long-chain acyl-CoA synthetase
MEERAQKGIYGCFEETAQKATNKPAIHYLGEVISYATLLRLVNNLALSLESLGLKRGDRAILYLYNIPQNIISLLALHRIGSIPVPVAPVYGAHDLSYLAKDSQAKAIFCMDSNFNYVKEILGDTPLEYVIVTNMVDLIPWWKKALLRGFDKVPKGKLPKEEKIVRFKDLLSQGHEGPLKDYQSPDPEDTCLILYTGGTTGFPKGVPLTSGLYIERMVEWRRASEGVVPLGEGRSLLAAPLYHIIGQMDAMSPLCISGEPLIMLPRVVLDALMEHVQRYRATSMFAVPTLYRMILEHDRLPYYDLSSLRYCGTGGDVLPIEVGKRWKQRFGIPLYQGYGSTELCGAICLSYSHLGEPPEGSAGKISPNSEAILVDPDTLEPVTETDTGELWGTSRYAVKGYWNKPQETKECFIERDGKIWYRTKDIIKIGKDGWLYFVDRSVDMIKHKGYRIAAAEIERVLQEHKAVMAACVVGVPDEKVGERIKAFVVLKPDVKGVSSYDLTRWCRERLAPYKVPQYIEFRDMLPKSKVGKMLRREIRAEELRKVSKA